MAQWPRVAAGLLTLLPTLPGWGSVQVFDGPLLSDDVTSTYVSVGSVADENGGTYAQVRDPDGYQTQESGDVRCELVCMDPSGGVDLAGVRTRSFALVDALEASFRADRRLGGVLSADSQLDLSVDVRSEQTAVGAFQVLVLTVRYFTVT